MDTKKSNTGVWVVVAVVVVIIVVLITRSYKRGATTDVDQGAGTTVGDQTASAGVTATEDVSAGSVTTPTAAPLSYAKALVEYKDRRIQFGVMCETTPSASTFKNGTVIMLDNRAGETRTFHLGTMGDISIKAWGFKLVKLAVPTTPNAMAIDCGTHQNAAIITVQK